VNNQKLFRERQILLSLEMQQVYGRLGFHHDRDVLNILWKCSFGVFFILGLVLLLYGCNDQVEGSCFLYNSVIAVPFRYNIFSTTCKHCSSNTDNGCNVDYTYPCYTIYAEFHLVGSSKTCHIQTCEHRGDLELATKQAHDKFAINSTYHLLQNKAAMNVCLTGQNAMDIYISGVFFALLAAIVLVSGSVHFFEPTTISEIKAYFFHSASHAVRPEPYGTIYTINLCFF
jgi:hypothetical protein